MWKILMVILGYVAPNSNLNVWFQLEPGCGIPRDSKSICGGWCLTLHKCFWISTTATEGTKFVFTVQGVQRGISEFRSKFWNFILAVLKGKDSESPCFKLVIWSRKRYMAPKRSVDLLQHSVQGSNWKIKIWCSHTWPQTINWKKKKFFFTHVGGSSQV